MFKGHGVVIQMSPSSLSKRVSANLSDRKQSFEIRRLQVDGSKAKRM